MRRHLLFVSVLCVFVPSVPLTHGAATTRVRVSLDRGEKQRVR